MLVDKTCSSQLDVSEHCYYVLGTQANIAEQNPALVSVAWMQKNRGFKFRNSLHSCAEVRKIGSGGEGVCAREREKGREGGRIKEREGEGSGNQEFSE